MNKKISIILFLLLLAPGVLFAEGLSVGANLWYAWFEPSFKNQMMGENDDTSYNNEFTMDKKSSFAYGGMLSYGFSESWILSCVISYGTGWECGGEYDFIRSTYAFHMTKIMDTISRLESDLSLSYAISQSFKIFCGVKYSLVYGSGSYDYYMITLPSTNGSGTFEMGAIQFGPGIGIGNTINITGNLFLISTLSGLYQYEDGKQKNEGTNTDSIHKTSNNVGGNATASLAYVFPGSGVTLSLGGRYQQLWKLSYDTTYRFYGAVLSAVYSF